MKLSVFTVATPDLTPEQLAAAANQEGLDGIEWRYKDTPEELKGEKPSFWRNNLCSISPSEGEGGLGRFKSAAESHGLETLSVTPYLTVGDVEGTEQVLSAARKLGAKFIRVAVPWYDGSVPFGPLFEQERAYLKQVEPLCKQYGVRGLVETHHMTITASASAAYRVCEAFKPDWIGVLYDPGNMVFEGFENYRMGLEILGPYLAHVHVKNAFWKSGGTRGDGSTEWAASWSPLKEGCVPWKQVVDDLKAVGYDGYLGVEDFSGQHNSAEMLESFSGYMRELID